MKETIATFTVLCLTAIGLTLAGCSGSSSPGVSSAVVSGVAAVGAPLAGQVHLKDSATPAREKSAVIANNGSFAVDVTGMKGPFILMATGTAGGANYTLYSFANGPGTANINPLSNVAVANAAGVADPAQLYTTPDPVMLQKIATALPTTISALQTTLKPLLDLYSASGINPVSGHYVADHTGLDAMFDDVKIVVSAGTVTVTNVSTNNAIFTCQVANISGGTFNMDNLPPMPGTTLDGATLYATYCASCHSALASSNKKGTTATAIQTAIAGNMGGMGSLASLTSSQMQAIADTLILPAPPPTVPAAPMGIMATGGTSQVTLFWQTVSGATSYNVYWATTPGVTTATGTKIAGAVKPLVLTGLPDGTTYYCIVTAVNDTGESAPSVQVAATTLTPAPAPTAPAPPTGMTATGGASQATISWQTVAGADSYNIYWGTASGITTATGTRIAGVASPYIQTGLTAGTTCYYIVTAVNGVGESAPSAQAAATTAPPVPTPTVTAPPTGVTATGGANKVTLSWSGVSGATSYNVYWSNSAGVTTASGTKIAGVASPYVQTGLAAGTAYYYIVTAVNGVGESAPSAQAAATTAAPAPTPTVTAPPTGVTATGGANQVTLSWSGVSGATSFNVYWSKNSGVTTATGTKITGATSPYVQTGLTAGTTYYYVVTAVNGVGESTPSSQASAATAPAPAPAPMPGKAVYDTNCAACHRLGTYDAAGSAPNLSGLGSRVDSKFTAGVAGHKGITLSATQITDLKAFLNVN